MPKVGKKEFPYTKAGKAEAKEYAKAMGTSMKKKPAKARKTK